MNIKEEFLKMMKEVMVEFIEPETEEDNVEIQLLIEIFNELLEKELNTSTEKFLIDNFSIYKRWFKASLEGDTLEIKKCLLELYKKKREVKL